MLSKGKLTLQVQAVLYNNKTSEIKRTVEAVANAVRVEREYQGLLKKVSFVYGDASEHRLFSDEEFYKIRNEVSSMMDMKYVFWNENVGFGKGNNLLAENCLSDYLIIMNPDVIVSPRTLMMLIKPFKDENVGIVEARQTPIEHQKEYDVNTMETGWASGACFAIKTELFSKVSGFDYKTFFLYCEDVDLSWRVRMEGYKIIYQPLSPVFHPKRLAYNGHWEPSQSEVYYTSRSKLLMAYKWSNPDLLDELMGKYSNSGIAAQREAVEYFKKIEKAKKLPIPLDPEHRVSKFIDDFYEDNRFVL